MADEKAYICPLCGSVCWFEGVYVDDDCENVEEWFCPKCGQEWKKYTGVDEDCLDFYLREDDC